MTVEGLAGTEAIVSPHRSLSRASQTQSLSDNVIKGRKDDLDPQGLTPQETSIASTSTSGHSYDLVQGQSAHVSPTTADLLKLAVRLQQPAKQIARNWSALLSVTVTLARTDHVNAMTEYHARRY